MSKSAFGGDLRLISQVVTLLDKYGDAEQLLKLLAGNTELLAYLLDFAAFHFGQGYPVSDSENNVVEMRLVCFSATSSVPNDEANLRVKRFGRYATSGELGQFFRALKDNPDKYDLCYPIVTHSIPSGYRTNNDYEFTELTYRKYKGLEFWKTGNRWLGSDKSGMIWSPATTFAVVAREKPNWSMLASRKELTTENKLL